MIKEAFNPIANKGHGDIAPAVKMDTPLEDAQENQGFGLRTRPATIIGSLLGAGLGAKHVRDKNIAKRHEMAAQNQYSPTQNPIGEGPYEQIRQMAENLRVIFTPISAIFVVRDGPSEMTVDTIETNEMNEPMLDAWKQRDHEYFKNLMLNKMHSEVQIAEQAFARRLLEQQFGMQAEMGKEASLSSETPSEMTDYEVDFYINRLKDVYSKDHPAIQKMAQALINSFENEPEVFIGAEIPRPIEKCAGVFHKALSTFGFQPGRDKVDGLQGDYLKPRHLARNVQVAFLPDRVLFTVHNRMVGSLPVINMNEGGFEAFQNQDERFFRDHFNQEVKKGVARLKSASYDVDDAIEKEAGEHSPKELFHISGIHPSVYFLLLTSRFGYEWVDASSVALVDMIEKEFDLTRPIGDPALNKILSVKAANNARAVYENPLAFEKIVRAFNDKPIDFMESEKDDVTLLDIVFAAESLNAVTPYDNVYDNFSPSVYDYMVSVMVENERFLWAVPVTNTDEEMQFLSILNYSVLHGINEMTTEGLSNKDEKHAIIEENEMIFDTSLQLIDELREFLTTHVADKLSDITGVVEGLLEKANLTESAANAIKREVMHTLFMDEWLGEKRHQMTEALLRFNLIDEGGESI